MILVFVCALNDANEELKKKKKSKGEESKEETEEAKEETEEAKAE